MKLKPVHIDGGCWVAIAFFASMFGYLTTAPDADKFISPLWMFWLKGISVSFGAAVAAFKVHRSFGGYGDPPEPKHEAYLSETQIHPATPVAPGVQSISVSPEK
jgi:hypothetical protein